MQCSGYNSQGNLLEGAKWHDNHANSWKVPGNDSMTSFMPCTDVLLWTLLFMAGEAKETPRKVRKCTVMSLTPGWQRTWLTCVCNFLTISMMVCKAVEIILPKHTQMYRKNNKVISWQHSGMQVPLGCTMVMLSISSKISATFHWVENQVWENFALQIASNYK